MKYNQELYERALLQLQERRARSEQEAASLRARAFERDPALVSLSRQLNLTSMRIVRAILDGQGADGVQKAMEALQAENQRLQAEIAARLHAMGEDADNFDPRPVCPRCGDTGRVDRHMCDCLKDLLREESCRRLSTLSHMTLTRFEDMDLSYYSPTVGADGVSPRTQMADILAYCRAWAADFSDRSPSLLLQGPVGTGKTHLSLAMAREVAEQGYAVVYGPVQRLLRQIEKEHFGKEDGDTAERLTDCELLILDDLGTEFNSPFYSATLYELINTRLLDGLPTILSTNLSLSQLQERYGAQIASRIAGSFQPLRFAGEDIRRQKLMRGL